MSLKVLGLDIGDSAVKAVLVTRNVTGHSKIIASDIIPVDESGGLKAALDQLFQIEIYRNAACICSLPAKSLSYRHLRLPFRDKKKIDQTIAYELEPVIQRPIDDIYFDYIKSDAQDGVSVLAAIVEKSFLDERIGLLAGYVKKITVIDADAVALSLKLPADAAGQDTTILLDMGSTNTVAVFISKGKILQMRHFIFGGALMTDRGARFIGELKNTVEYLIWQGVIEVSPSRIYMTGGGALIEGIEELLSEAFPIPVERLDILKTDVIPIDTSVKQEWQPLVMNQALALATRAMDEAGGFNFRRRVLETKRSYDEIKKDLRWISAVILIIFCLGIVDVYLDYSVSKSALDSLKRDVITEFKKHSPETTRIMEPVSQMKAGIAQARKITGGISISQSDVKVLDMIKELSALTPASASLIIRAFNFENGVISIKGQTKNFDSVDAIKNEIAKSKYFKSVVIGATNLMKQGDQVEFDMRIEIY